MIRLALVIRALVMVRICGAHLFALQPAWMEPKQPIDQDVPYYQRVPELSGTIHSIGSATTGALIWAWAEEFKKIYPNVEFDLKGGHSAAVLPAMLGKTPPNLGPMSRPMSAEEMASFKKRFGYEPIATRVGINAIGLFVN